MTGRSADDIATLLLWALLFQPAAGIAADSRYAVAADASELRVLIWRAGPLARFGHNHVAVTRALRGTVLLSEAIGESSVALSFPAASLVLDEPAVRAAAGPAFAGEIAAEDIAATRENMLGPQLLDAAGHPSIMIESTVVSGSLPDLLVAVRATVAGQTHTLQVPVSVNTFEGGLVAIGRTRLAHAAIGLEPFRVAFGSLRVADELVVEFRIVARRD